MSSTDKQVAEEYPTKPYSGADGTLIIPLDCDPKYHHWKGRQTVLKTLEELDAPPEVVARSIRGKKSSE